MVRYGKVTPALRRELARLLGRENVLADPEQMADYAHDEFALPGIRRLPEAVVRPRSTGEVAAVMRLAARERLPVVPRGGGTGLCGGCVPALGGLVLDTAALDRVEEVDRDNFMARCQAGVTLKAFYDELKKHQLFFPPHPGEDSAMLGGLVATNAGGARAVRYGTIRHFVRGLEVVLADGETINPGGRVVKDSSGYSLLNLLIGSEGTLGVVTRVTLGVMPRRQALWTLVVPYADVDGAINSSTAILRRGVLPLALEFLEDETVAAAEAFLDRKWPGRGASAYLMIIVDGTTLEEAEKTAEALGEICLENGAGDVFVADSESRQEEIMFIRGQFYEVLKADTVEILDTVVPRAEIAGHAGAVRKIGREFGVWLPTYGHAGDGNVHTHIMKLSLENGKPGAARDDWPDYYRPVRAAIHEDARARGGRVSGEHGIGLAKMDLLPGFLSGRELALMREIKRCFDPGWILNPGKIFSGPDIEKNG